MAWDDGIEILGYVSVLCSATWMRLAGTTKLIGDSIGLRALLMCRHHMSREWALLHIKSKWCEEFFWPSLLCQGIMLPHHLLVVSLRHELAAVRCPES